MGFGTTKLDLVSRMTEGLVSWRVAYDMHSVLHVPLLVAFTSHTFADLRCALARTTRRSRLAAWLGAELGLIILGCLLRPALSRSGL